MPLFEISQATRPDDIATARELLREYERALGVDLSFQGFAQELANLPGDYAPPRGALLLARNSGDVAGCIALRVIAAASATGYRSVVLNTLPSMVSAQRLYESFGFADIATYRHNPIGGTRALGLGLAPARAL